MKYCYYFLQIVLVAIVLLACKKLTNDAFQEHPVSKATLKVSVVNDDDQQPVVGVKVIISRKISPKGDYVRVDTIRTNQGGQLSLEIPYPNYLKVELDTTYYHADLEELEFVTANGGNVVLHTTPKYGMSPLAVSVTDSKTTQPIPNLALSINSRVTEQDVWLSTGSEKTDVAGKLMVSLPYPNLIRVAVADTIKYFPDTVLTALKNIKGAIVALKTELKPLTVPLEVTVLDKDNSAKLANVGISILQKLTGEADFKDIGLTGVTDKDGKLTINAPYSGQVKIKTNDDIYFTPDSVITSLAYEKNRKVTLLSKLLSPAVAVDLSVFSAEYGVNNKKAAFGTSVKVSYKKKGQTVFTDFVTSTIAANGKLSISIPLADEFKFEVAGDQIFVDKVLNFTNTDTKLKQIDLSLALRPAKYPEPVLTNLQVSSMDLNNGLSVNAPQDVVIDKLGNRYITEGSGNRLLRVDRFGNTTVLAGTGTAGSVDGSGATAQLNGPWGIAIDKDGNLYTTDNAAGHKVRKITLDAVYNATVTTIAGSGTAGGTNGVGTAATFNRPSGLCYDEARNCLYVAEWSGHRVRKIDLATNTVSLIAGSGASGTVAAGVGAAAVFNFPWGVKLSPDGSSLYVTSPQGSGLSKIRLSDNSVTLLALSKTNFVTTRGLYVSPANKVILASTGGFYITQMTTEGAANTSVFTKLTGGAARGYVDGTAAAARFSGAVGIAYDPYTGVFYIADGDGGTLANNKIRIMKSSDIQ